MNKKQKETEHLQKDMKLAVVLDMIYAVMSEEEIVVLIQILMESYD